MCREVAERHRQHGFGTIEHQCRGLGIRRSVTLATNRTLLEWRFANWSSIQKFKAHFGQPHYEDRSDIAIEIDIQAPEECKIDQFSVTRWFEQACDRIDACNDARVAGHLYEADMRTMAKRRLFERFTRWQTYSQNQLYQLFKYTGRFTFERLKLHASDGRYDREGAPAQPVIHGVSDVGISTGLAYQVFTSKYFRRVQTGIDFQAQHGEEAYMERRYLSAFVAFIPRRSAFNGEAVAAVRGFFDTIGVESRISRDDGDQWYAPPYPGRSQGWGQNWPRNNSLIVVSANPDRWTKVNRQAARFWALYLHMGEACAAVRGHGKVHLPNGVDERQFYFVGFVRFIHHGLATARDLIVHGAWHVLNAWVLTFAPKLFMRDHENRPIVVRDVARTGMLRDPIFFNARTQLIPTGFAELVLGRRTIENYRGVLPVCNEEGFEVQRLSISIDDEMYNQEHVYSRLDARRFDSDGNPLLRAPIAAYARRANIFCDFEPDVQSHGDPAWRYVDRAAPLAPAEIVDQPAELPAPVRVSASQRPGLSPIFEEGNAVLDTAVDEDDDDLCTRLVIDDRDLLTDDEFSDDEDFYSCRSTLGSSSC
ncbi:unnamed protein product [Oikopleura dioica]|uniref:Uncharacterized protein n=1 Tax=Oikopleura dioica TaxID=34765 RepID=E4XZB8_OIKDI|nr:unnamed protein product [Oikopleura dioica]